jgi:hypothetical protein
MSGAIPPFSLKAFTDQIYFKPLTVVATENWAEFDVPHRESKTHRQSHDLIT